MNQKDLLLVGGGLVAGYVICKMMNRNSDSMSFSLSGEDKTISEGRGYEGQQFKFNGKGVALTGNDVNQYFAKQNAQRFLNQKFGLTGKSEKIILSPNPNLASHGTYEISDSPNAIQFLQTTLTISREGRGSRRIWLPAESLVKI
jgi:hypothetical protein